MLLASLRCYTSIYDGFICFHLLVVFTPSVKVENGIVVADFLQGRLVESRENADFENYRKILPTQLSVGHSGKMTIRKTEPVRFGFKSIYPFLPSGCSAKSSILPCICHPRVNITSKKARELAKKEKMGW